MAGLQAKEDWRSDLRQEFSSEPYLVSLKQAHKGCIVDLTSEVWVQLSGFLHVIQALSDIALQEGRTSALALSDVQYLTKCFLYE